MEPWVVGLVALVVVGLGVILFGALLDRARNRRRTAEMLSPPPRTIPRLDPEAPDPTYVSNLQARRRPAGAPQLSAGERSAIEQQLGAPSTVTIKAGYASKDFVTDTGTGWAALDHPLVLVCDGPVESVREILPALERALSTPRPLAIVAESYAPEVLATLEVNVIQGKLALVALTANAADRRTVAATSRAKIIDRSDRQSGCYAADQLGSAARWVSTTTTSQLVVPADQHEPA